MIRTVAQRVLFASSLALVMASVVVAPAEARDAPLADPGRIQLVAPGAQGSTPTMVRSAILAAAMPHGWTMVEDKPGRLVLNFNKGNKHRVNIEVSYDERSFEIRYIDSVNLNHAQRDGTVVIHPNYNRWVKNLAQDTRTIYTKGGAAGVLPAASAPN